MPKTNPYSKRRLLAELAQRCTGDALDEIVGVAHQDDLTMHAVGDALVDHPALTPPEIAERLRAFPLKCRLRFAARRAAGPGDIEGLLDGVDDLDAEVRAMLTSPDDAEEVDLWPGWLYEAVAGLVSPTVLLSILHRQPPLLAEAPRLLGRFDLPPAQLRELLRSAPVVTSALLASATGPVYDAALDVAVAGWAGELDVDVHLTPSQLEDWVRRRPAALCAEGDLELVSDAGMNLVREGAWRVVEVVTDCEEELWNLCNTYGDSLRGLERLGDRCTLNVDVDETEPTFWQLAEWATSTDPDDHRRFSGHLREVAGSVADSDRLGYLCSKLALNDSVGDDVLAGVAQITAPTSLACAFQEGLIERGSVAPEVIANLAISPGRAAAVFEACTDPRAAVADLLRLRPHLDTYVLDELHDAGLLGPDLAGALGCRAAVCLLDREGARDMVLDELVDMIDGDAARAQLALELIDDHPGSLDELRAVLDTTAPS